MCILHPAQVDLGISQCYTVLVLNNKNSYGLCKSLLMVLLFSIFKPVILSHLEGVVWVTWIHLSPLETSEQKSAGTL